MTYRHSLLTLCAGALLAAGAPAALAQAPAAPPLKIGFVYVGPVSDAGWTAAARHRPQGNGKGAGRQGGDPVSSKTCRKAPTPSA